ncbi:calcium-binding protein [Sphingomonas jatrophae]|uniref:DUF4214 domain-containing protein n=1 Tax=Sphingomonas jatrophae TaxID=1166337 RepID=A0A1I6M9W6_9SPHN|nr:calcium-binding protein [Sphingomonas jatrophae]SFS12413.1 hypothetical protein SAMN05192580_3739 [Sphingomonas jatrophae]
MAQAISSLVSGRPSDAIFSADGQSLFVAQGNTISRYDVASGTVTASYSAGTSLGGLSASAEGRYVVAVDLDNPFSDSYYTVRAHTFDLTAGSVATASYESFREATRAGYVRNFDDSLVLTGDRALVTGSNAGPGFGQKILNLDFATNTLVTTNMLSGVNIVVSSVDGAVSFISASNRSGGTALSVLDAAGTITASLTLYGGQAAAVSGTAGKALVAAYDSLTVYDLSLNAVIDLSAAHSEWRASIPGAAFSPDGRTLYLLDASDDTVVALSTADWSIVSEFAVGAPITSSNDGSQRAFGDRLTISADGQHLSIIADDRLVLVDLTDAPAPIANLYGDAGNNDLTATAATPNVFGLTGNDIMRDGEIAARLHGGLGDDTYYLTNAGTVIDESDGGANDRDTAYVSQSGATLMAGVEVLAFVQGASGTLNTGEREGVLIGANGDDVLNGAGRDDSLIGGGGNDRLFGNAGNDYLTGSSGNDLLDGGDGFDVAIINATSGSGTLTYGEGGSLIVTTGDGVDTLRGIERIQFVDGWLSLANIQAINGLYVELGGRPANLGELMFWSQRLDSGRPLNEVRIAILDDPLGRDHGVATITTLYQDFGGRSPSAAELDFWSGQIRDGSSYANVRAAIIDDPLGRDHTTEVVTALYNEYGGRDPNAAELQVWQTNVRGGATYADVRVAIMNDPLGLDHSGATLGTLYQEYFGRAPANGEVAVWQDLLRHGADYGSAIDALMRDAGSAAIVDRLTGTAQADTFDFGTDPGHATVAGFQPGIDKLDLDRAGYDGVNPLDMDHAREVLALDGSTDVLLTFGAHDTILLYDVSLHQLAASDFMV